ncbi:hypothetical protein MKW92_030692 [Papaver armeniacum]|nr:hypothetical protein MKW92_030692 [Papaver armeniacum]
MTQESLQKFALPFICVGLPTDTSSSLQEAVNSFIQKWSVLIVANLDAAWTGENVPGSTILEVNGFAHTEVPADSSIKGETDTERLKLEKRLEDQVMAEVTESHHPVL